MRSVNHIQDFHMANYISHTNILFVKPTSLPLSPSLTQFACSKMLFMSVSNSEYAKILCNKIHSPLISIYTIVCQKLCQIVPLEQIKRYVFFCSQAKSSGYISATLVYHNEPLSMVDLSRHKKGRLQSFIVILG